MCTLTWGQLDNGYHVHFNRDESRLRARGLPPSQQQQNSVSFLAPVDPQAQGTWILCNEYGLSVCLLNNYVDITPTDGQRSRGLLVRDLSCAASVREAVSRIEAENMSFYQPFDAFLFDFSGTSEINWDGKDVSITSASYPFKSSSGFDAQNVIGGRREQFEQSGKEATSLRQLHRSHHPEKSAYSVCMHREDARTQSYTEIIMTRKMATMSYIDGPPCTGLAIGDLKIPLKSA